jgi:CheY-specific phosphatase CheX
LASNLHVYLSMNANLVNRIINSVVNATSNLLGVKPLTGKPCIKKVFGCEDLNCFMPISASSTVAGYISISFDRRSIEKIKNILKHQSEIVAIKELAVLIIEDIKDIIDLNNKYSKEEGPIIATKVQGLPIENIRGHIICLPIISNDFELKLEINLHRIN